MDIDDVAATVWGRCERVGRLFDMVVWMTRVVLATLVSKVDVGALVAGTARFRFVAFSA